MIINKKPDFGNGFIYILGHPSMQNIYKVGLTTNSVKKRIQELTTTGVPKPFKAKKIFEIDADYLRDVEQLAHKKLKVKKMHYGKEFFKGSLSACQEAVEDAIYEITQCNSQDLIGEAAQRAKERRYHKEQKRIQSEYERQQLDYKRKRLEIFNQKIDKDRGRYKFIHRKGYDFVWYELFFILIYFGGMTFIYKMSGYALILWIFIVPFIMYKVKESRLSELAKKEHPHATMENIDKIIQKQAIKLKIIKYKKECDNGNSLSCNNLGDIYLTPTYRHKSKGREDDSKAVEYYQKACNLGNSRSCGVLGMIYADGKGVIQDYSKVVKLYKKACDLNSSRHCFKVGAMYDGGQGVEQNKSKAVKYYKKACNLGNGESCCEIGYAYEDGTDIEQNNNKAIKYYRKACDLKDEVGCQQLQYLIEKEKTEKEKINLT